MSVSGSQVFSLVLMAVDGRSAGKNNSKDVVCVPAALLLLVSGLRETDPKDTVSEAPGNAGCCQGSFRQSLVFVKWFSQAQCFCFMATLVVSEFSGSGMVENGSLAAASCCSSQQLRNELEKQRLSVAWCS